MRLRFLGSPKLPYFSVSTPEWGSPVARGEEVEVSAALGERLLADHGAFFEVCEPAPVVVVSPAMESGDVVLGAALASPDLDRAIKSPRRKRQE